MKKEQAKKGKKGPSKKKDATAGESKADEAEAENAPAAEAVDADEAVEGGGEEDAEPSEGTTTAAQQSKQRSESFRQRSSSILSPAAEGGPQAEVQELYRKQAGKIEELEKENKSLKEQQDERDARLAKAEEELETLREGSSDMAELKSKAKEADRLSTELSSVQRQLAQAQQTAKGGSGGGPASTNRRISGTGPDLSEQLASKTSTVESLELEISNLRNQVTGLHGTIAERDASAKELEERATAAETATATTQQELNALRVSIAFPSDATQAANEDPEALTKRITVLESDLRTANTQLDAAAKRATSLEQKIEALTKLHREGTAAAQLKDRELGDLRAETKRRDRPSHVRDASEFELGEEETEIGQLQARTRALEAENFDLRRGVWRERRAEMQPGMMGRGDDAGAPDTAGSGEYEDVDLYGPYSGARMRDRAGASPARQTSTFQDVITSGINAFTGRARDGGPTGGYRAMDGGRERKQSLGLMSEDGFDEDAFRLAQEEEAKRRIERVKEVKRGLDKWKGWRVDIADLRQNGLGPGRECGPVFEV